MFDLFRQSYALLLAQRMYTRRFLRFGAHPKGVLWKDAESQNVRYEILMEYVKNRSMNDFGCGYGGLYEYALSREYTGTYVGYDMNASMIAFAKKRFPNGVFYHANRIHLPAEVTVISGTLNLKMNASDDVWWRWIQKTLTSCWAFSTEGMIFNLLVKTADSNPNSRLFYCSEEQVVTFCRKYLSRNLFLIRSSSLADIHIYIRR
ncbi:MAG: class I SAM-dependent methyltransferase [Myxococcota bacterium]|nr:class I SAM-dependent methyltransferase [Myxococcota bacterium]